MQPRGSVRAFLASSLALLALTALAPAATLWSDDFTGESASAAPTSNYPGGNATQDWSPSPVSGHPFLITTAVGNAGPSLGIVDNSTSQNTYLAVNLSQFSPFNMNSADAASFTARFDLRLDSFANGGSGNASTFRFSIVNGNSAVRGSTGALNFTLGFGRAAVDADAGDDLFFFAAVTDGSATSPNPGSANAIGYGSGAWAPGFDFGNYAATAADNDTSIDGASEDFYRFEVTFTQGSDTVQGRITNTRTNQSTLFTRTYGVDATRPAFSFSNSSSDRFSILVPQSGTGTAYFDNFEFVAAAIPEPSVALLMLAGMGCMTLGRWRR